MTSFLHAAGLMWSSFWLPERGAGALVVEARDGLPEAAGKDQVHPEDSGATRCGRRFPRGPAPEGDDPRDGNALAEVSDRGDEDKRSDRGQPEPSASNGYRRRESRRRVPLPPRTEPPRACRSRRQRSSKVKGPRAPKLGKSTTWS